MKIIPGAITTNPLAFKDNYISLDYVRVITITGTVNPLTVNFNLDFRLGEVYIYAGQTYIYNGSVLQSVGFTPTLLLPLASTYILYLPILKIKTVDIITGGSGYASNNVLTIDEETAKLKVATIGNNGDIESVEIVNGGSRYTTNDVLSILPQGETNVAELKVQSVIPVSGVITGVTIDNKGKGYVVGDILTNPQKDTGELKVESVASGVITSVSINNAGEYYILPTNPVGVTGGGGGTFNLTPTTHNNKIPIKYTASANDMWTFGTKSLHVYNVDGTFLKVPCDYIQISTPRRFETSTNNKLWFNTDNNKLYILNINIDDKLKTSINTTSLIIIIIIKPPSSNYLSQSGGIIKIDNEEILYGGYTVNGDEYTLTDIVRGYNNTIPTAHSGNSKVLIITHRAIKTKILAVDTSASVVGIQLNDVSGLSTSGTVRINNEEISYTNITGNTLTASPTQTHVVGAVVSINETYVYRGSINLNDVIKTSGNNYIFKYDFYKVDYSEELLKTALYGPPISMGEFRFITFFGNIELEPSSTSVNMKIGFSNTKDGTYITSSNTITSTNGIIDVKAENVTTKFVRFIIESIGSGNCTRLNVNYSLN